jgi:hypothetical protein
MRSVGLGARRSVNPSRCRGALSAHQPDGLHLGVRLAGLIGHQALERLTKPFDISPTNERASERKKRLMDVRSSLISNAQSSEAMKPPKSSLNHPTPSSEPFF